jgi:hypothetical protein
MQSPVRLIRCFEWQKEAFNIEIPFEGNITIAFGEQKIFIPQIHQKNHKNFVYFEGNVPEEGFGRNVDGIYRGCRQIEITEPQKAIEKMQNYKHIELSTYLVALQPMARLLFWDYRFPSFRMRYAMLMFKDNVAEIMNCNNP